MLQGSDRLVAAWRELLLSLGCDLNDPHLRESPERVARFFQSWISPATPPDITTFPNERYDEVVAVGGIRFYSLCAHHGLPFSGTAAVGYIPSAQIVGLSKIARIVDHFAHRFQTQEMLTTQIADLLDQKLHPLGVGVILRAEHLCMSMRGIQKPGHITITSEMRGAFREKPAARAELLALLQEGSR